MNATSFLRLAFSVVATVAIASCAGGAGTVPTARLSTAVGSAGAGVPNIAAHAAARRLAGRFHTVNGIRSDAKKQRLVYASDFNNSIVDVYEYPSGKPAGTLTDFLNPQGQCADTSDHNVFIADTGNERVVEYAYGASSSKAAYSDPGEYPVDCSIDPTTGNLAIANIFSPTTGIGGVTVCSKPSYCTTFVEPSGLFEVFFLVYVGNGDLYVDGFDSVGVAMVYLRAGSSTWQPVNGVSVNFPGNMQWDGKYLAVGDQSGPSGSSVIYRCKASGPSLSCDDRNVVLLPPGDVAGFFIKYGASGVVGADVNATSIATWAYPAGGYPTKSFVPGGPSFPSLNGIAILRKP